MNPFAGLPATLPDSWAPSHGWISSWLLPLGAAAIALGYVVVARPSVAHRLAEQTRRLIRRGLFAALGVAALAAIVTYCDFGVFRYGTFLNEWDVYHYYVGTKYARELGYMEMYEATLVADAATGLKCQNPTHQIRNLRDSEFLDMDRVLAEGGRCRGLFSEARWNEFVADIAWFKEQLPRDRWGIILRDKGYNGTPAWSFMVGGILTNNLSIRSPVGRFVIVALDPLYIGVAVLAVVWAFDLRTALFMIVLLGTHYFMSWGHMKGALLRTDFALGVVLAVCLVKKGWYRTAGTFLGWAILARVFPVFFLVGPGLLLLSTLATERRIDRRLLDLLLGCGATVALIAAGSLLYFHGLGIWQEWLHKIGQHYRDPSDWNVGYQPMTDVEFQAGVPRAIDVAARFADEPGMLLQHRLSTWIARLLVLAPGLVFARALKPHESVAYGFVYLFFLSAASYYYYFILCVPLLFFAHELERPERGLGLVFMLLTGVAGYLLFAGWAPLRDSWVVFHGWKQLFPTTYFMCWLVCATALHMVLVAALEAQRAARARADAGGPSPALSRPAG